ncbi:glmS [Symbiodinium natans]|uniref:GlmS protein n=1 Tax=Symbiodinium natans TaxID=878477 RepID=A0A812JUR6_9DINO|nr:glmS [Symbiodinium natans]
MLSVPALHVSSSPSTDDTDKESLIADVNRKRCNFCCSACTLELRTDAGMYLHAGPEIGVASTKAFTCQAAKPHSSVSQAARSSFRFAQVVALLLMALRLGKQRGVLSEAMYFRLATNAIFSGMGIHYPVALEGALKLKDGLLLFLALGRRGSVFSVLQEISYIHAEGFPASEIRRVHPLQSIERFSRAILVSRHGSITLIRNFVPQMCRGRSKDAAVVVLTDDGNTDFSSEPSAAAEQAVDARFVCIQLAKAAPSVSSKIAHFTLHCPDTKLELQPLMCCIPLQLLSYYIADMRGCSIDQPRNLAKSVTVE